MTDSFTLRVRSAAIAGWWTILIGIAFILLVWLGYLRVLTVRPDWVLRLSGPDITWAEMEQLGLRMILAFRFLLWVLILAVVFLSLWARRLRKLPDAGRTV